jgi:aminoglycoside phosphotransferase (APT) family kinase protein
MSDEALPAIEPDDLFVTLDHLHSVPAWGSRPGYCHRGARALCAQYGLDWAAIVRDGGIPASALLATGDALALHLVEHARQEVTHGNG